MYGAERLEAKIRSVTQNWSRPAYYLKCDIANFFVSIEKSRVRGLLLAKIHELFWRWLTEVVLMHDQHTDFVFHGGPALMALVPPHKRLMGQSADFGLPIGNLSSQFCANVFLDVLGQYVKHRLGMRHYIRYVDDFIFAHESVDRLKAVLADVTAFLPARLGVRLNPSKTILQPVGRGVDFVGQIVQPWCRSTRKRTRNEALRRVATVPTEDFLQVANSYFGLLGQATASHHDRARLGKGRWSARGPRRRAKALTDAKRAGYDIDALQVAGAHTDRSTTEGYIKSREVPISTVVLHLPDKKSA